MTTLRCTRAAIVAALAALAAGALSARASVPAMNDCLEGSDFIANAARAREHGMTREAFVARLDEDLLLIHAFPPELRWFARDEDDARFLRAEVEIVFDVPESPDAHRADFLRACLKRITG